ncbi:MAG: uracil-DNA glycosylase [bacterium]|nr:uracil-DNA glycosylase [Myxococcales bacterium]MCB9552374.1 uracil-DNA glycosylase [Myxococcales bacterium]
MEATTADKRPKLPDSWLAVLGDEFETPHMQALRAFLAEEQRAHRVYPPNRDIFNAFWLTPFDAVRVVILGQDPYHGPNQAHGLCFSVRRGVPPPPSLQNIFREIDDEIGIPRPDHGELTHWAEQGVLLLNAVLTVRAHQANSHRGQGWERFTDRVISELDARREGLVFVLWGSPAKQKAARVDRKKHLVLTAAHPSPLSAHKGFFGCGHFARVNEHLQARGEAPIDWRVPD